MKRLTMLAVLIPVLGLVALIGRAEIAVRSGPAWQIRIGGYDPRDLLHGRYLRFQYQLNRQGTDTCGHTTEVSGGPRALHDECCLCLTRDEPDGINPPIRQVRCNEVHSCDGWLRSSELVGVQRYFVPEDRALELEGALRNSDASLELTCGPGGRPAIRELMLDGRPWRERR